MTALRLSFAFRAVEGHPKRKAQEEEEGERDGWGFAVLPTPQETRGKGQEPGTVLAQSLAQSFCTVPDPRSHGLSEEVPRRIP